jgi:hypothetical protein
MRSILSPIFCTMLFFAAPALAEPSLSDLLFDDCNIAEERAKSLSSEAAHEAAELCVRMLTLPSTALVDPKALAIQMSTPLGSSRTSDLGDLLRSAGPARDLKGKQCALRVLENIPQHASLAFPTLLSEATNSAHSDTLRNQIIKTAEKIAPIVETKDWEIAIETISGLTSQPPAAVIFLLRPQAASLISRHLAGKLKWKMNSLSLEILDPTGSLFESALLLDAGPENCQTNIEAIQDIQCPSEKLIDVVLEYAKQAGACQHAAIRSITPLVRKTVESGPYCSTNYAAFRPRLWTKLLSLIQDYINAQDTLSVQTALEWLVPLAPGRKIGTLEKLIESTIQLECAACSKPPALARLLSTLGTQSLPIIFSALKSNNPVRTEVGIAALNLIDGAESKQLTPCLALLHHSQDTIARACYHALSPVIEKNSNQMQRILAISEKSLGERYVTLVLYRVNQPTPKIESAITKHMHSWNCDSLSDLSPLDGGGEFKESLLNRIGECFNRPAHDWSSLLQFLEQSALKDDRITSLLINQIPKAREHVPTLVRALQLVPVPTQEKEFAFLFEQLNKANDPGCEISRLIWASLHTPAQRQAFLADHSQVLNSCHADTLPQIDENEILKLIDPAAPIPSGPFIHLLSKIRSTSGEAQRKILQFSEADSASLRALVALAAIRGGYTETINTDLLTQMLSGLELDILLEKRFRREDLERFKSKVTLSPIGSSALEILMRRTD